METQIERKSQAARKDPLW